MVTVSLLSEVFVYGTLMPGGVAWGMLEPFAESFSPDAVTGVLVDTGAGYPGLLERFGPHPPRAVPGVSVRLAAATAGRALIALDRYEDVDAGLYERVGRRLASGREAWVYLWTGPLDRLTVVEGGWSS
jgi:gamma-glutamylcyclotransferase (GGCT)/AIG2-like uncharacterized protein YtfP